MTNIRNDVTHEKCVRLYREYKNASAVADRLDCDKATVLNRLRDAGVRILSIHEVLVNKEKLYANEERRTFNSKAEQAHYICNDLRLELADFIHKIKMSRKGD